MHLLTGIQKSTNFSKSILKLSLEFFKNAQQPYVNQRKSCFLNHSEYVKIINAKNNAVWLRYRPKTADRAV
jgi:hypothetical protein